MIYDIEDNPIASYLTNLDASGIFQCKIRVNCRTGLSLASESVSDLLVEAKHEDDSSWVNLETTPIDLTAFDGTRQNFDVRLTAAAVSVRTTRNFRIYTS